MRLARVIPTVVLFISCLSTVGLATTLSVPSEYPDIRTAITAAQSGDSVLVAQGIYTGPGNTGLTVAGKQLYIQGVNGAEVTTIDGSGTAFAGFGTPYGEIYAGTVIEGFTVSGASYGLFISSDGSVIRNCRFVNNTVAGISADYYQNPACSVVACTISNNPTGFAPFYHDSSPMVATSGEDYEHRFVFKECTFESNQVAVETFAELRDCKLTRNQIVFRLHVYPWVHVYDSEIYANESAIALLTGEQNDAVDRGSLFLYNCLIHDNQGGISRGASLDRPFGRLHMTDCLYYHNGGHIDISPLPYATVIKQCTFADNTNFALRLSVPRNPEKWHELTNNIVAFNQGLGIQYDPATTGLVLSCNDFYANDSCDYCGIVGEVSFGFGNVSVDPLFEGGTDNPYGLSEDSECLIATDTCPAPRGWRGDDQGTPTPSADTIPPAAIGDLR